MKKKIIANSLQLLNEVIGLFLIKFINKSDEFRSKFIKLSHL